MLFRIIQARDEEEAYWHANAVRLGYDPDRYSEIRGFREQIERGERLSDVQWNRVKEYMASDKSGPFRQSCAALASSEAKHGRPDAVRELRRRLDDPDAYVVASTLTHLVKWLKVPDSRQVLARFANDNREPVADTVGLLQNLRHESAPSGPR